MWSQHTQRSVSGKAFRGLRGPARILVFVSLLSMSYSTYFAFDVLEMCIKMDASAISVKRARMHMQFLPLTSARASFGRKVAIAAAGAAVAGGVAGHVKRER